MGEESAVMDSIERERANRQREVVAGYHIFASYGWGDDGSGHISARDPLTDSFWLLRAGVAFARATLDDLVLVGPDGAVDRHGAAINPAAYCIHAPIHHARRDVVGIAHTHTGYGTPFAALARPLRPTSQEACAFHGDQNVFAGEELNVVDIVVGRRLAAALAGARLLVLSNPRPADGRGDGRPGSGVVRTRRACRRGRGEGRRPGPRDLRRGGGRGVPLDRPRRGGRRGLPLAVPQPPRRRARSGVTSAAASRAGEAQASTSAGVAERCLGRVANRRRAPLVERGRPPGRHA
jgi:ribulose-5-phosphate 4-epimerase/fuculose-1-phosphate aldolase